MGLMYVFTVCIADISLSMGLMYVFAVCFQVWFQNRRAKFRRNERNILAQRNTMYGRPMDTTSVEQPIGARPTPMSTDYLSWSATAYGSPVSNSSYSAMTSPMQTSPTTSSSCALAAGGGGGGGSPVSGGYSTTGPNIGSSIASLRLKAREYNMHQTGYMPPHPMTS